MRNALVTALVTRDTPPPQSVTFGVSHGPPSLPFPTRPYPSRVFFTYLGLKAPRPNLSLKYARANWTGPC